jgi:hypothetical protein
MIKHPYRDRKITAREYAIYRIESYLMSAYYWHEDEERTEGFSEKEISKIQNEINKIADRLTRSSGYYRLVEKFAIKEMKEKEKLKK